MSENTTKARPCRVCKSLVWVSATYTCPNERCCYHIPVVTPKGTPEWGSPEFYIQELEVLSGKVAGKDAGVCNGAAITIRNLLQKVKQQ